jgi:hypothetical protein
MMLKRSLIGGIIFLISAWGVLSEARRLAVHLDETFGGCCIKFGSWGRRRPAGYLSFSKGGRRAISGNAPWNWWQEWHSERRTICNLRTIRTVNRSTPTSTTNPFARGRQMGLV